MGALHPDQTLLKFIIFTETVNNNVTVNIKDIVHKPLKIV